MPASRRTAQRRNDVTSDVRLNGDVKPKPEQYSKFPWNDFVGLWALTILYAFAVPFFAKNVPAVPRSDLTWWMAGVVYQVPPPIQTQRHYLTDLSHKLEDLRALGVNTIRISDLFQGSPDGAITDYYQTDPTYGDKDDFIEFTLHLRQLKMKLILDMSVAYTSTSHDWFKEDRKKKSHSSIFSWMNSLDDDDDVGDDDKPFKTAWRLDEDRQQFYQHAAANSSWALLNYGNRQTRLKIQDVIDYWLRLGVDGFILLHYDAVSFRQTTTEDDTNHIQTDYPYLQKINNMANLTRFWRQFVDAIQEDDERAIFLGVDLNCKDQDLWHTIYESGANMILNHELVLSKDGVLHGDHNPFNLRNRVKKALSRVPNDAWNNWKICDDVSQLKASDSDNTQNLLNMMHLLLPGVAILCPGQLPQVTDKKAAESVKLFQELVKWRETSAMSWGDTETSLVNKDIFSFARFAFGKAYPRYLFVVNFGHEAVNNQNFTMKRDRLHIPDVGILRYSSCPEQTKFVDSEVHKINSVVYLNTTTVNPRCGLLIELVLNQKRRFPS